MTASGGFGDAAGRVVPPPRSEMTMPQASPTARESWPELPVTAWEDTRATLHMWLQVVGKIRLAQMPMINHWWQVPLYATSRGLTTSPMPYGARLFQIDIDFIEHKLVIG